jgi:hypothetical protein
MSLKFFSAALFATATLTSHSQLKVHSNGTVSIGTTTSSGYSLTVDGYSAIKITYSGSYMRFSSATANGVISSTADIIAFWESGAYGYHRLDASQFNVASDSALKTNIEPLDNGLEKVMELNPCTYNLKEDVLDGTEKPIYGFIAQEVQQVMPELVDSGMGVLTMNYDQIIPLLVESVQIQQAAIDSLTERITDLEASVYDGGIQNKSAGITSDINGIPVELGQNNPNPFKESTSIPYNIPKSATSAQIIVYDMRGVELESYTITEFGENQLLIEGNTFKPGMYIYALIVNGQYIDSKRMILSK